MKKLFGLACLLTAGLSLQAAQDKVEIKTIDGVIHVLNAAKPLKGTVKLEVERTRTINPYDQPDVAMRMILFCRDAAGQVILYDPNGAEGHRFAPDGKYLGLLTKKGQGPGEFSPRQGYHVDFHGLDIWVFGGRKVARIDGQGRLVKDKVLRHHRYGGVDAGRFLTMDSTWTEKKVQISTLKLIEFSMDGGDREVDLLQAENIGEIRNPNGQGGFSEGWGTPNFFFAADPERKRVLCGVNTEYRIQVKDYSGKNILVIEKAYEPIKARRADVEKIMPWALKDERLKWVIAAYPDRFVAINDIRLLPQGLFGVFRVSGPEMFEIDVFSPEGECLYVLIPPDGVKMNEAAFFSSGFALIEPDGDYSVYREYRIKNLPEVFRR